jgi:uncharacterized membrane protein
MRVKKLIAFLLFFIFVITPAKSFAAGDPSLFLSPTISQQIPNSPEGWYINSFNSAIAIQPDGSVTVHETIAVDFKDLEKHGIFRDIPLIYRGESGNDIYTDLEVNSVSRNGTSEPFQTSRNGDFLELKIGDANQTISGPQTYDINYSVKGILKGFSGYDELYWNLTGNDWPVPILEAHGTVTTPQNGVLKFVCYQGSTGSREPCLSKKTGENEVVFNSTQSYDTGEGMTLVVGYKKGMVPLIVVEKPKTFFEKFIEPSSLLTTLVLSVIGVISVILLWMKKGRDSWFGDSANKNLVGQGKIKPIGAHETVVVEYTPPKNLRPAEIGVLMDEKADTLDVTSTIIDLAARGYLNIREIPKKWVFGSVDYELVKNNKSADELLNYEKELYNRLFDNRKSVTISSLKRTFYSDLAKVKTKLYEDVQDKKLFAQNPETTRSIYTVTAAIILIVCGVLFGTMTGVQFVFGFDVVIASFITAFVLLIFSFKMSKRTAYGRELYRESRGYELFISTAEKYKQRFFEDKNLFNEVLPYAIVFGLTDKFAKKMHDIGIKPENPNWYVGGGTFNPTVFASNVSSFSNSFSSAIASAPSSRGGFSSGGGFSGGGFGGGGGGSW